MIRTLLTTTALALALTAGAHAQTDNTMAPADNSMAPAENTMAPADNTMAPADNAMAPAATSGMGASWDMSAGYSRVDTDNLASRLMGMPVYSTAGDDAEEIGTVNDLVISTEGEITAVVIGVGGFLGIGEKNVAVSFDELSYELAADNTERWVLPTTAEALTAAPDFVWEDDLGAGNAMAPADTTMAPADNTMAPADNAMAPADTNAMTPTATTETGMMPREGYNPIEREALTAENLTGATVVGPEGDDIANVGDILLTEDGQVDAMLIDFGGFLGIGQKRVAVSLDNLDFASNENGDIIIYSDFTREQLEAQPEYDEATYASDPAQRATDM